MRRRVIAALFLLFAPGLLAAEADPALLQKAVEGWLGERDHWAFTQRAVEYEGDKTSERLERFDPSKPGEARWKLLAIDGHPPTAAEHEAWAKKKFRKAHRHFDQPLGDFFDFEHARVVKETPSIVQYEVPLRSDKSWLFPIEKVRVTVTINRQTQALEHLSANVREPFRVFLGLARILGGDVDLSFLNFDPDATTPDSTQPKGAVHVKATRFGERVDFTWSDFQRVVPVAVKAPAK